MRLEEPYDQKQPILITDGRFLITGKDCTLQKGYKSLEQGRVRNSGYFVILKSSGDGTIWVAPGSQIHLVYSDKEKAELFEVSHLKVVRLPWKCVLFEYESVQHAGDGWKQNH